MKENESRARTPNRPKSPSPEEAALPLDVLRLRLLLWKPSSRLRLASFERRRRALLRTMASSLILLFDANPVDRLWLAKEEEEQQQQRANRFRSPPGAKDADVVVNILPLPLLLANDATRLFAREEEEEDGEEEEEARDKTLDAVSVTLAQDKNDVILLRIGFFSLSEECFFSPERVSNVKKTHRKEKKKKRKSHVRETREKKNALLALSLVEEKGRFCVLPRGWRDVFFFWSDDDAGAEEKNGRERFVGCDCQQRRYLFRTHFAEIESNWREVFVRREYGDEGVGEEIVSERWVEKEFQSWRDVIDIDFRVCVGESIVMAALDERTTVLVLRERCWNE
jgi:hypothetical protein